MFRERNSFNKYRAKKVSPRKYYRLKVASEVKGGWKTTKIKPCGNCKRPLRIQGYWLRTKKYKNFYCDKRCEAKGRHFGENLDLKGGYRHTGSGYAYVRISGMPYLKHRIVMERFLKRKLSPNEHVHHLNGKRHDNRIENLQVVSNRRHPSETLKYIKKLQRRIRELERVARKTGK